MRSVTGSGGTTCRRRGAQKMQKRQSEFLEVLDAAAMLQEILPEAVLVGGTAAAIHAEHRLSHDADHILNDLRDNFDEILGRLESIAGWKTARIQRPVQILGSLDGIETGIRQLIRAAPLETMTIPFREHQTITLPTQEEMVRIKGVLILKRNATRDYLDFAAVSRHIGDVRICNALASFDTLYPQASGQSALQQLQVQLSHPKPYDLESDDLGEYRNIAAEWQSWENVKKACGQIALMSFERDGQPDHTPGTPNPF